MTLFEETELRLGLPGGGGGGGGNKISQGGDAAVNGNGKRGYHETSTMDLKLKLSSDDHDVKDIPADNLFPGGGGGCPVKPPAKWDGRTAVGSYRKNERTAVCRTQMVGWPPVGSYRKNMVSVKKSNGGRHHEKVAGDMMAVANSGGTAALVKVSMDGAPYLRKVDLKMYKSYQDFSDALGNMFSSFTIGNCGSQGMKDFMNEIKLLDLLNNSDYVPTYEDKDGDWMLVGDVPWEMFVDSCKRLRIMKGKEAVGIG